MIYQPSPPLSPTTTGEEAGESGETNGQQEKKEEGVELAHLSEAGVHLRDGNNLIEGVCCFQPAVVTMTLNFFINLWHAEEWGSVTPRSEQQQCGGGFTFTSVTYCPKGRLSV